MKAGILCFVFSLTLLSMCTDIDECVSFNGECQHNCTTQMVAIIVHVLIQLGIPSVKMDTVVLVCAQLNKLLQLDKNAHTTAPCV